MQWLNVFQTLGIAGSIAVIIVGVSLRYKKDSNKLWITQ
jgi:hypothetical protein